MTQHNSIKDTVHRISIWNLTADMSKKKMTYSTFVLERLSLLLFSIKKNIV